jgi:Family of unknown function (DUF6544)
MTASGASLPGLDEPVRRYFEHAIRGGAHPTASMRMTMAGRVRAGLWLPFTARQECDGRSFAWRARVGLGSLTLLTVTDRYRGGAAVTEGRLLGRARVFHADDEDTCARPPAAPRWRASSPRPASCRRAM